MTIKFLDFKNTSDEDIKFLKSFVDGIYLLSVFVGIPFTGFFYFVWESLGKGLAFIIVFFLLWAVPISWSCKSELKKRETMSLNEVTT